MFNRHFTSFHAVSFLGVAALLGGAVPACSQVGDSDSDSDSDVLQAEEALSVNATVTTGSLDSEEEHCVVHQNRWLGAAAAADATRWRAGTQLRIMRGTKLRGMCTVSTTTHNDLDAASNPDTSKVKMTTTGFTNRVKDTGDSATSASNVTLDDAPATAAASMTLLETATLNDVQEHLNRPGTASIVYTSPHPWENMAPSTGGQSLTWNQLKSVEALKNATTDAYWAPGMANNKSSSQFGGTNTPKMHVTSDELSGVTFPLLQSMFDSPFKYAVAFHGTGVNTGTCDLGAKVGGRLGYNSLTDAGSVKYNHQKDRYIARRGIAENIKFLAGSLVTAADVGYLDSDCGNSYNGTATNNFVNRIARNDYNSIPGVTQTDHRGIQIETGGSLSQAGYNKVGEAVRSVFDCLAVSAASDAVLGGSSSATSIHSPSDGTLYANDVCKGFVVEKTFAGAGSRSFTGGLQTCADGAKSHVDIYKWNTVVLAWDRIGGGDITHANDEDGDCQTTYVTPFDGEPGSFVPTWQPGDGGNLAATYRMVVYGYNPGPSNAGFAPANALTVFADIQ